LALTRAFNRSSWPANTRDRNFVLRARGDGPGFTVPLRQPVDPCATHAERRRDVVCVHHHRRVQVPSARGGYRCVCGLSA
jgi:hypothetical protein